MICDLSNGGTPFITTPVFRHSVRPRSLVIGTARSPAYFYAGEGRGGIPYCVFQYTLSGRGVFTANGKRYSMMPGSGFLTDINDPAYTYFYPEDGTKPWRFVYLQMVDGNIHEWVAEIVAHYGYYYELDMAAPLLMRFERVLRGKRSMHLSAAESAEFITNALCSLMQSRELQMAGNSTTHLTRQAMGIIAENPNRIITASELAKMLQISREHLSRVFRTQMRTTPYQFILDQKIQQASVDLRSTTLSIKEIAAALGFRSPAQFTQVFTRSVGHPPSKHRNQ